MFSLNQFAPWTDDFAFTYSDNIKEFDTLIIHNPPETICFSPVLMHSRKSLEEHISFIAEKHIKKAVVVAEDISFLQDCPDLEDIRIIPPISAKEFDYSPVYELHNLHKLSIEKSEESKSKIVFDSGRVNGLKCLMIRGWNSNLNLCDAKDLKTLILDYDHPRETNLEFLSKSSPLENLVIGTSRITSLSGIENAPQLKRLELYYNKKLQSIEDLRALKDSLIWLEIDSCGAISDFSVLSELENLEYLQLRGSKSIPSLDFLKNMKKLKILTVRINVLDGDLSGCLDIPYVEIDNKKHYTHKNSDFSKELSFIPRMENYY